MGGAGRAVKRRAPVDSDNAPFFDSVGSVMNGRPMAAAPQHDDARASTGSTGSARRSTSAGLGAAHIGRAGRGVDRWAHEKCAWGREK